MVDYTVDDKYKVYLDSAFDGTHHMVTFCGYQIHAISKDDIEEVKPVKPIRNIEETNIVQIEGNGCEKIVAKITKSQERLLDYLYQNGFIEGYGDLVDEVEDLTY